MFKISGKNFSSKRALGITSIIQKFAKPTGVPTTKSTIERKISGFLKPLLNNN